MVQTTGWLQFTGPFIGGQSCLGSVRELKRISTAVPGPSSVFVDVDGLAEVVQCFTHGTAFKGDASLLDMPSSLAGRR